MKKMILLGLMMSVNTYADCNVSLKLKSIDENQFGGYWGERSIRGSDLIDIQNILEKKGYAIVENSANTIDIAATFSLATHWEAGVMEITKDGQAIQRMQTGQVVPGVDGEVLVSGSTIPNFSFKARQVVQGLAGLKGTRALNGRMMKWLAEKLPTCL